MVRIRSPILFTAIVALLTLGLAAPGAFADPLPGGTLDPTTIPKYVIPLVIPPVMNDTNPNNPNQNPYEIAVRQFRQQILPGGIWNTINGRGDAYDATTVWSYGPAADPKPDSAALGGGVGIAPAPNSQFNYPAYTVESTSNVPVSVRWINDLKGDFGVGDACLSHLLPIDQTLHWANPPQDCRMGPDRTDCAGESPDFYTGPVPIVTHVHGAHVDPHSDGYPEAWWLPACDVPEGYATSGSIFDDVNGTDVNPGNLGYADYLYRQDQPATTLWYHDHSLGMTRSNVYAGPAGFWLVRGGMFDRPTLMGSPRRATLPGPAPRPGQSVLELNLPTSQVRKLIREIPIVIQDRSFDANGASLFYPDNRAFFEGLNVPGELDQFPGEGDLDINFIPDPTSDIAPIWNPEAFFNVMVVNGVSWPDLDVADARYRFRFLNGCNSRFLILRLVFVPGAGDVNDPEDWVTVPDAFWQIGAEQGFLPQPVQLTELLMGLAERADVIMDFAAINEYIRTNHPDVFRYSLHLVNVGPDEPFGGGTPFFGCNPDANPPVGPPDCFEPSDPGTTGQVMRFTINPALFVPQDRRTTPPDQLVLNGEASLEGNNYTRQVSLNEGESELVCVEENAGNLVQVEPDSLDPLVCPAGSEPFGPKEALLGILDDSGDPVPLKWTDTTGTSTDVTVYKVNGDPVTVAVTENPTLGNIETWEIYNFTADAHPIHLHLVRFQVLGREVIGGGTSIAGTNDPLPWETGFKDTVISYPGEITRVKALFDIEGLYVWHCHIVEHEDNEMMRPYVVSP